ncbi:MAG: tRNA (guanosine(37)-N1)-methyltransferase TrmD [Clostridia bacterium]|nr:tRNA (guanosine(37)-N1)-methyltransferase TrmD [Clostridia bacterium]
MIFDVMTLFPELINKITDESIIGRAKAKGIIAVNAVDIRNYTKDRHRRVDDYPYGGGYGMVMQCQPIYDCFEDITKDCKKKPHTVYMSPKGTVLTQKRALELSQLKQGRLVILCGHYEGVDQRVLDEIVDEEISIGDYVLTGGEIPACVLIDCISRMIDGVLAGSAAYEKESHFSGLLEHPQYTRPEEWHGRRVPEILLSGHHANIEKWKDDTGLELTKKLRPDILENK